MPKLCVSMKPRLIEEEFSVTKGKIAPAGCEDFLRGKMAEEKKKKETETKEATFLVDVNDSERFFQKLYS